jgi:hypothetical protein
MKCPPNSLFKPAIAAAVVTALAVILFACSSGGYGMVLWGDVDSGFRTGQLLRVREESKIRKVLLVHPEGSRQLAELPSWRVRQFPTRDQAQAEAERYSAFLSLYGYSERDGLPLREEPKTEARQVYRLAAGQLVKVLQRSDEKVPVAGYEDYWYLVLTEDGYEGYAFGYYLPVFVTEGDPKPEVEKLMARDPLLEALLSTPWRPDYFQAMVDAQRIDLTGFSSEIGFFVDAQARKARLVTPKYRQEYDFQSIDKAGANHYVIADVSSQGKPVSDLRVQMQSRERLVLTYARADQVLTGVYIAFSGDIENIIADEHARREELFRQFTSRGRSLTSSAYGTIRLQEGMRFLWEDYGRLGEQIFLKKVRGGGTVDFPYYLGQDLASRFEGVISFHFQEYTAQEQTSFLYTFDQGGLRLLYLPPESFEGLEAVRTGASPLGIYFSFGGS